MHVAMVNVSYDDDNDDKECIESDNNGFGEENENKNCLDAKI